MTTRHTGYQAIPDQDEAQTASDLRLEDDEDALAEEFVAQERVASNDSRIKWINFILGCAILLPWNVLITAAPYFLSRLEGSSLKSTFSSYLTTSATVSNFIFLAHATATTKQSNSSRRVMLALYSLIGLVLALTISTYFHPPPGLFFAFVILNGIAQNAAGSYLQTSVIAVASLFGPTAIQAIMSGQAAIAIAVSGVQMISAAASVRELPIPKRLIGSAPEEKSAFIFFTFSTVFLLVAVGAHVWLTRLPAYKALMTQFQHTADLHASVHEDSYESNRLVPREAEGYEEKKRQLMRIARSNIIYNVAVAYVFLVTLAVFPPITLSIQSTNPNTHPLLFGAIHFFVFNVGDFLGRSSCSMPRMVIWSAKRLITLSFARTLFIPIFLMCNVQRPSSSSAGPPVINSDILYMLILLFFGFSNGYVSSLCMMSAPSVEHNPKLKGRVEDVDTAATVATFCLVGGLAIGSFTSFGVRAAVCNCNPFHE